jgi:hypothetical protein
MLNLLYFLFLKLLQLEALDFATYDLTLDEWLELAKEHGGREKKGREQYYNIVIFEDRKKEEQGNIPYWFMIRQPLLHRQLKVHALTLQLLLPQQK